MYILYPISNNLDKGAELYRSLRKRIISLFSETPLHQILYSIHKVGLRFGFFVVTWFDGVPNFWVKELPEGYYSQFGQDYILEMLGVAQRKGLFVEVGSNHPVKESNSYLLERKYNWTGISIDALDYSADFLKYRKNTKFINALISAKNEEREFFVVKNRFGWQNRMSSVHKDLLDEKRYSYTKSKMDTIRLNELIMNDSQIDLLLIDVEGAELEVLNSVDWDSQSPKYILTENTGRFIPRREINSFLKHRGYLLIARIGFADQLWERKQ